MNTDHLDPKPTLAEIIAAIASLSDVHLSDIMSGSRAHECCRCRAMFAWSARRLTRASYPEIAAAVNSYAHPSAMHAESLVEGHFSTMPAWVQTTVLHKVLREVEQRRYGSAKARYAAAGIPLREQSFVMSWTDEEIERAVIGSD